MMNTTTKKMTTGATPPVEVQPERGAHRARPVQTAPPRAVFLCGHRSRYGAAHLEPIRRHFDLAGVVLASDQRWETFSAALSGRPARDLDDGTWRGRVNAAIRSVVPATVLLHRAQRKGRPPGATDFCRLHGIATHIADDVNSAEALQWIGGQSPDVVLCAAFPQILDAPLLELAPLGAVNFHPSALPKFRGAHPHYWAIATGADRSGLTAHYMTGQLDRGNIIGQIEFPIEQYTYSQFYDRLVLETEQLVRDAAEFFMAGGGAGTPQDERAATFFTNDRDDDHRIDWAEQSAAHIANLARTERAWTTLGGAMVVCENVDRAGMPDAASAAPGTILDVERNRLIVAVVDGAVRIGCVRVDGDRHTPMQLFRRLNANCGDRFI